MNKVEWDKEIGGVILNNRITDQTLGIAPRPVFFEELDLLGLDKLGWVYPHCEEPLMWAINKQYYYRGEKLFEAKGANIYTMPTLEFGKGIEPMPLKPVDMSGMLAKTADIMFVLENVVYIHAGTFTMGSPVGEENREDGEVQHQVTLTKGFYMAKYQTTNAQFAAFLNAIGVKENGTCPTTDSYPAAQHPGQLLVTDCTKGDAPLYRYQWGMKWNNNQWEPMSGYSDYPAIYVSWYGADEYAHWQGGSLPTEAQWEYACRAGSTTAYTGGNDKANGLGDYGWYRENSQNQTHPVGTKKPNAWGLYDMHGNVFEWCLDGWTQSYSPDPVEDPLIPITGIGNRMMRGGTYSNPAGQCRSAYRNNNTPGDSFFYHGFRIVFNE